MTAPSIEACPYLRLHVHQTKPLTYSGPMCVPVYTCELANVQIAAAADEDVPLFYGPDGKLVQKITCTRPRLEASCLPANRQTVQPEKMATVNKRRQRAADAYQHAVQLCQRAKQVHERTAEALQRSALLLDALSRQRDPLFAVPAG